MQIYKTAMVIIPSEDIWEPIQKIREKYDNKIDRWMPNITLFYPFLPDNMFGNIKISLEKLQLKSFDVYLEKIEYFKHKQSYTLWLNPEPKSDLTDIYLSVRKCIKENFREDSTNNFTPHLTIGRVKGETEFNKVYEELKKIWKPTKFRFDKISLICRDDPPNDKFKVAETAYTYY